MPHMREGLSKRSKLLYRRTVRVLKLFDGDYPWDVRVEKIAGSLVEAGHEVRLLCRNRAGRPRRERDPSGFEIARLPALPAPLTLPLPFSPVWLHALRVQLASFRPSRLLVRDLPLAPLALALGRRAGIPVIADLSEPYPDSLRSQHMYDDLSFVGGLVRSPRAADAVERFLVRRIDRVLVVCPEAGVRLEQRGLPAGRWVEVGNTPRLAQFARRGTPTPELDGLDDRFTLFFSGLLAGDRGLEVAVDALACLAEHAPSRFALVIVGEGPMRAPLAEQARRLGLDGSVRLPGFIVHDRLPDLIVRANVGMLPFHSCPHINSTLANKLFEYMALELPVIVSDVPPMRRVIEETGCGLLFRPGDAADLARAIDALAGDTAVARRCGAAGAEAVRSRYHWGIDAERLVAAVETAVEAA
jgi:glycosyltransferase involved in cell wall biosynthesis